MVRVIVRVKVRVRVRVKVKVRVGIGVRLMRMTSLGSSAIGSVTIRPSETATTSETAAVNVGASVLV